MSANEANMAEMNGGVADPLEDNNVLNSTVETEETETDQDKNWKAVRSELSSKENEIDLLNRRLAELENTTRVNQQPQENAPEDNDLMMYGEFRKKFNELEAKYSNVVQDLAMKSTYSDYNEVANIEHLRPVLDEFPELEQAIMTSNNPRMVAYTLGKLQKNGSKITKEKKEAAQKMIDNANKPGTLANATASQTSFDKVDKIKNMGAKDFNSFVEEVKKRQKY